MNISAVGCGFSKGKIMTRGYILFLTLAALFVLQIDSASACRTTGKTKNGEPLCATTSDKHFGDGRRFVPKAVQAMRIFDATGAAVPRRSATWKDDRWTLPREASAGRQSSPVLS